MHDYRSSLCLALLSLSLAGCGAPVPAATPSPVPSPTTRPATATPAAAAATATPAPRLAAAGQATATPRPAVAATSPQTPRPSPTSAPRPTDPPRPTATAAPVATTAPIPAATATRPAPSPTPTTVPPTAVPPTATPVAAGTSVDAMHAEIERYLRDRGSPLAGRFRIERVTFHNEYARADIIPVGDASDQTAGAYLRREAGAWRVLAVGTAFLPEDLQALGVPRELWPAMARLPGDAATPTPAPGQPREKGGLMPGETRHAPGQG